ncbi:MAG: hypothetical protein AAB815_00855, partial [Patescibacteria group bacterium]
MKNSIKVIPRKWHDWINPFFWKKARTLEKFMSWQLDNYIKDDLLKEWKRNGLIIILFIVFMFSTVIVSAETPAFYFRDNTLFWCYEKEICPKESNSLKFSLDKKIPPTVNEEPIKSIW